ncbi:MAG: acylneuraminate cytidylyltransferase family protein, partial [Lentisphaerota bacterium]
MSAIAALIVARAGSKSVPRKNIRPLAGKPLIAWTFEAAKRSVSLDRIILSTDDPEMAELGRNCSIHVPFMRPAELAGDTSHVIDATLHALHWLENNEGYLPDYFMLLQPTSPFRSFMDIDAAARMALDRNADAVVSVAPARQHPCLMKQVSAEGVLCPWIETGFSETRRQDLPPAYAINGAIYLVRRSVLLDQKSWCPPGTLAYVMPEERSLDIDSPWDFHVANVLMNN